MNGNLKANIRSSMIAEFYVDWYIVPRSLTMKGCINVDEFGVIRVGFLITFVKLNNHKQSRSCRFVNGNGYVNVSN